MIFSLDAGTDRTDLCKVAALRDDPWLATEHTLLVEQSLAWPGLQGLSLLADRMVFLLQCPRRSRKKIGLLLQGEPLPVLVPAASDQMCSSSLLRNLVLPKNKEQ